MSGRPYSVILVPTLDCNVACDYCFEDKRPLRLSLADLPRVTNAVLDHMAHVGASEAEVYWQGGEVLLLGPAWFETAHEVMGAAAAARGLTVRHYLQSNLIGYGNHWDPVIRTMFGGSVGTSMDVPNDHRRLKSGSTERYTEIWLESVVRARDAGLHVSAIAVVHAGTLRAGAREFLRFFAEQARIDDVQVNLPFPGGSGRGGDTLAAEPLSRFLVDLLDVWMSDYREGGLRLAPFGELIKHFLGRPARLPCIWQPNCADEFVTIDARGQVALCDCWVASYPEYAYGNVFRSPNLAALLDTSAARRALLVRPARLMDSEGCDMCPYLALCHGGCPVRAFAAKSTIYAKDPYCEVYKALFARCSDIAGVLAARRMGDGSPVVSARD